MITFFGIILISIFCALSGIHFYWAMGGKWVSEAVFPTQEDNTIIAAPGIIPTLIVAIGLMLFVLVVLTQISSWTFPFLHDWIYNYGIYAISFIFIVRAMGEFRYVGLFKKVKHTPFAKNDTLIYTPLCIIVGVLSMIVWVFH